KSAYDIGAGIWNDGVMTLTNSTVSGNNTQTLGGGDGGGISNLNTMTIINSTIAGNYAFGGAGISTSQAVTINMVNTIVAQNVGWVGFPGPDVWGPVTSLGHNLVGDTSDSSGWIATDLTGTVSAPLDPKLGALADNGGPTQTMALLNGSPAIGSGDEPTC